jgi:hypothetical protein
MNKSNSFSNGKDQRIKDLNNGPIWVLHSSTCACSWCLQGV